MKVRDVGRRPNLAGGSRSRASVADRTMDEKTYRYHRWRDTVIRERRIYDVEALTPHGWAYTPYALDALTGMGEDPHSCGEWCDAISDAEAATIARAKGLALEMESVPGRQRPQR